MEYIDMTFPADAQPSRELDGVLHRLLVGPATFLPRRPPIVDGGGVVMPYTANLEAAATLFDGKLPPAQWRMLRAWDHDEVEIGLTDQTCIRMRCPRGHAALALCLLILAAMRIAQGLEDWDAFLADLFETARDVEKRRHVQKIA